ncbi:MAG: hypothetical protein ACK5AZ_22505 [Bryobacteraceae bacterium]
MDHRLIAAFLSYAFLGLLALLTLEGTIRLALMILLGGLAVKTWIAHRMRS